MMSNQKFYIGVACQEHVENGKTLGIAQFCHGKKSPAARLKFNDFVVYYSPKKIYGGDEPCQQFTAIGQVRDHEPYQVDMGDGFKPFRRNILYLPSRNIDIRPLIDVLPFITNKSSWGGVFRFGFLEIDAHSFEIIHKAMTA